MRILAFLTEPAPIHAILRHLDRPTSPRPVAPRTHRHSTTSNSTPSTPSCSIRLRRSIPLIPIPSRTSSSISPRMPQPGSLEAGPGRAAGVACRQRGTSRPPSPPQPPTSPHRPHPPWPQPPPAMPDVERQTLGSCCDVPTGPTIRPKRRLDFLSSRQCALRLPSGRRRGRAGVDPRPPACSRRFGNNSAGDARFCAPADFAAHGVSKSAAMKRRTARGELHHTIRGQLHPARIRPDLGGLAGGRTSRAGRAADRRAHDVRELGAAALRTSSIRQTPSYPLSSILHSRHAAVVAGGGVRPGRSIVERTRPRRSMVAVVFSLAAPAAASSIIRFVASGFRLYEAAGRVPRRIRSRPPPPARTPPRGASAPPEARRVRTGPSFAGTARPHPERRSSSSRPPAPGSSDLRSPSAGGV